MTTENRSLQVITTGFDCDRTCPLFERVDLCRFQPLLRRIGTRQTVNSHTVTVQVKFDSVDALTLAVEQLGGTVLGFDTHDLFAGQTATGFGFTLPGWQFPLVATETGELAFDDYNGKWGNPADVATLQNEYAIQAATIEAANLGWQSERVADANGLATLRVYHPSGGYLNVNSSVGVDAVGFNGIGCHEAATQLSDAIGTATMMTAKPEYNQQQQQQQQHES